MSARWQSALDDFEDLIEEVELAMQTGSWPAGGPFIGNRVPTDERPTVDQQERARRLATEMQALQARVDDEMEVVRTELGSGQDRRRAAASYAVTTRLAANPLPGDKAGRTAADR